MGIFSSLFSKKQKMPPMPSYIAPPKALGALENFDRFKSLTPWRDASMDAATSAAQRLGTPRSGLLNSLVGQAQNELALGGALNAEEIRAASQMGNASAQMRGLSGSPQGALMSILSRAAASNARARERQGFAAQVAGMENEGRNLDLNTLAGAQQGALGAFGLAEGVRQFDTEREDSITNDRNSFNMNLYSAKSQQAAAANQSRSSGIGGLLGGVGSILSRL